MIRIHITVEKTDSQCSPKITTINIPLDHDIWLCVTVKTKFIWWTVTYLWSIHLT